MAKSVPQGRLRPSATSSTATGPPPERMGKQRQRPHCSDADRGQDQVSGCSCQYLIPRHPSRRRRTPPRLDHRFAALSILLFPASQPAYACSRVGEARMMDVDVARKVTVRRRGQSANSSSCSARSSSTMRPVGSSTSSYVMTSSILTGLLNRQPSATPMGSRRSAWVTSARSAWA